MREVKLVVGAVMGIMLAFVLNLTNPLTAGTVVLLSLGKTRKSSLKSALVRMKALGVALPLASFLFLTFGFTVPIFALFMCLYLPIVLKLKWDEGLIIGAVMSGQLLAKGTLSVGILLNAVALFCIGVGIAFLLNLYMPDMDEQIKKNQKAIEDHFRNILLRFGSCLMGRAVVKETDFNGVLALIKETLSMVDVYQENSLLTDRSYHAHYVGMRRVQLAILRRMDHLVTSVDMSLPQATLIGELTFVVAQGLSEFGDGKEVLARLGALSGRLKKEALPTSREEFENRAILFQYLSELRHMIELKAEFSNEYGRQK